MRRACSPGIPTIVNDASQPRCRCPLIYLASQSPRRQELLRQIGVEFDELQLREAPGRDRDVVEEARDGEPPLHYVERIARTKATIGWQRMQQRELPPRPVLGADTEVVLDGAIFGKPRGRATPRGDARAALAGARTTC